ncbi:hypothetical protein APHAL10511_007953 [Amanita phalloides]|nr:hypothetical protein APHAL10511_007953 [Amanita phalloides]
MMSRPQFHRAAIALGSNLGDRFRNVELALRLLEEPSLCALGETCPVIDIVDTSFMYETAPMYVTEQPAFINCACIVETNLEPIQLLHLLKRIEQRVGREPGIRYGPRAVDLDIVFFDNKVVDTRPKEEQGRFDNLSGELVIPHPRLIEREFVLRPLNDMIPDYEHPILKKSVKSLLSGLTIATDTFPMRKVIPFPRYPFRPMPMAEFPASHPEPIQVPPTLTYWTHPHRNVDRTSSSGTSRGKTHPMAIINVTPDSFSDGSQHNTVTAALAHALSCAAAGANILDIGGYSTRPGADFVSAEQEISRIKPVIEAVRQESKDSELHGKDKTLEDVRNLADVIISVDTFRPEVAEAAILSGASCINDVYAFTGPVWWKGGEFSKQLVDEADESLKKMKRVAKKYSVPVILMHSRGDAGTNKNYNAYSYAGEAVVEGVRVELGEKIERIVTGKGGLRRWLVIADVGIGFSKSVEGNLELLRSAAKVMADVSVGLEPRKRNPLAGFPQLVGASRKSFLGALLEEGKHGRKTEPKERAWATAAAVACSIQQEALLVRVHDIEQMMDVVRVSDAIWS